MYSAFHDADAAVGVGGSIYIEWIVETDPFAWTAFRGGTKQDHQHLRSRFSLDGVQVGGRGADPYGPFESGDSEETGRLVQYSQVFQASRIYQSHQGARHVAACAFYRCNERKSESGGTNWQPRSSTLLSGQGRNSFEPHRF